MCKCKVTWCSNETEYYNKNQRYKFCSYHENYKKYCGGAGRHPHKMYKVEKAVDDNLVCESCKTDMVKKYPNESLKVVLACLDVDHINSRIKGTPQGEHPNNYQLLCKNCHIIKSFKEGDYINKRYKTEE
jgi:hypothetical protein